LYNLFIPITLVLLFAALLTNTFTGKLNAGWFFILSGLAGILFYAFYRIKDAIFSSLHGEFDETEEKINLLTKELEERKKVYSHLPLKGQKASFLFKASQDLVELIDPDEILNFLLNSSQQLFPQADNILIFIFDGEKGSLNLVSSVKRKGPVVKEKKGDELDKWVLRHNQSLLVEDIAKDFRFDYGKVGAYKDRGVRSFVASPLSIGNKFLGIARLENAKPLNFSLDDSRMFRYLCDLGAVVLERANLFQQAQDMATKDSLTSLLVKENFFERLEEEIKRAKLKQSKLGLIMLDIDDFKNINDTYGHIVGDFVLKRLARILGMAVRGPGDVVSRFGGEEFIISLVECDKDKLLAKAEEIRSKVEQVNMSFRRKKINFTVSLGAVLYPDAAIDATSLTAKADEMLYKAKNEGKNRVCFG